MAPRHKQMSELSEIAPRHKQVSDEMAPRHKQVSELSGSFLPSISSGSSRGGSSSSTWDSDNNRLFAGDAGSDVISPSHLPDISWSPGGTCSIINSNHSPDGAGITLRVNKSGACPHPSPELLSATCEKSLPGASFPRHKLNSGNKAASSENFANYSREPRSRIARGAVCRSPSCPQLFWPEMDESDEDEMPKSSKKLGEYPDNRKSGEYPDNRLHLPDIPGGNDPISRRPGGKKRSSKPTPRREVTGRHRSPAPRITVSKASPTAPAPAQLNTNALLLPLNAMERKTKKRQAKKNKLRQSTQDLNDVSA